MDPHHFLCAVQVLGNTTEKTQESGQIVWPMATSHSLLPTQRKRFVYPKKPRACNDLRWHCEAQVTKYIDN